MNTNTTSEADLQDVIRARWLARAAGFWPMWTMVWTMALFAAVAGATAFRAQPEVGAPDHPAPAPRTLILHAKGGESHLSRIWNERVYSVSYVERTGFGL